MIVAFDPGGTTGCAMRMNVSGDILTCPLSKPEEVFDMIRDCVKSDPNTIVVYEDFIGTKIDIHGSKTIKIIGGIVALCYVYKLAVTRHTPQKRRPFLDQSAEMMSSRKNITVHEKDALAHLLAWEFDNAIDPEADRRR